MACKATFIVVTVILSYLSQGVHSKLDKIKFFLTNYEVTKINEIHHHIKYFDQVKTEKSFKIKAFGKELIADVENYYPKEDAEIQFISKLKNSTGTFLEAHYVLHHGSIRDYKDSLVLGYFTYTNEFRGYIVTDEVYCIEPFEPKGSVIVYRFKDVIVPGCSKLDGENLDCSDSKYFESWKANRPPPKPKPSKYSLFVNKYLDIYNQMMAIRNQTNKNTNKTELTTEQGAKKGGGGKHSHHDHNKSRHDKDVEKSHKEKNKNGAKYDVTKKPGSEPRKKGVNAEEDEWVDSMTDDERKELKGKKSKSELWLELLCANDTKHSDEKSNNIHHSRNNTKDHEHEIRNEKNGTQPLKKGPYTMDYWNEWKASMCTGWAKFSELLRKKNKDSNKTQNDNDEKKKKELPKEAGAPNVPKKIEKPPKNQYSYNVDDWNNKWMDSSTDATKSSSKKGKQDTDYKKKESEEKKPQNHTKDHDKKGNSDKHDNDDDDDKDDDVEFYSLPEYIASLERKYNLEINSTVFETFLNKSINLPDNGSDVVIQSILAEKLNRNKQKFLFNLNNSEELEQKTQQDEEFHLSVEKLEDEKNEFQCDTEIVASTSYRRKFHDHDDDVIKDIFTQVTFLNMIFRKVDLQKEGLPFHITFSIRSVIIYGDEAYNPFTSTANLEFFTTKHHVSGRRCFCIGFVNQFLQSGQFYDGYIPDGGGGACASFGNTLIVSHGSADTPAPMALFLASLMRGFTRSIGANDMNDECKVGSYPNPMTILQDYVITKAIKLKKEYSIFTQCNVDEIAVVLTTRDCLLKTFDPLCGNGVIDEGEKCDCGPRYFCKRIDPCCTSPYSADDAISKIKVKGCQLIEGAQCGKTNPCCDNCKIMKEKVTCYSGVGTCDTAVCDGKSADCPTGPEASNGMICSEFNISIAEPLICKDQKCLEGLCTSFGLKPCTCAMGTERDCNYCCLKDGKCKAAGKDLKLVANREYLKPDGAECVGGICVRGKCVRDILPQLVNRSDVKKPPRDIIKSGCCSIHPYSATFLATVILICMHYLSAHMFNISNA